MSTIIKIWAASYCQEAKNLKEPQKSGSEKLKRFSQFGQHLSTLRDVRVQKTVRTRSTSISETKKTLKGWQAFRYFPSCQRVKRFSKFVCTALWYSTLRVIRETQKTLKIWATSWYLPSYQRLKNTLKIWAPSWHSPSRQRLTQFSNLCGFSELERLSKLGQHFCTLWAAKGLKFGKTFRYPLSKKIVKIWAALVTRFNKFNTRLSVSAFDQYFVNLQLTCRLPSIPHRLCGVEEILAVTWRNQRYPQTSLDQTLTRELQDQPTSVSKLLTFLVHQDNSNSAPDVVDALLTDRLSGNHDQLVADEWSAAFLTVEARRDNPTETEYLAKPVTTMSVYCNCERLFLSSGNRNHLTKVLDCWD